MEEGPTTSGEDAAISGEDAATSGEDAAARRQSASEQGSRSGWVTTEVAAAALSVAPRTVRGYIQAGELEAKLEGEGVNKRWLVSIDSLHAMRDRRRAAATEGPPTSREFTADASPSAERAAEIRADLIFAVQDLQYRLGRAEARAQLTERAESTLQAERDRILEDLRRERKRADNMNQGRLEAMQGIVRLVREYQRGQQEADRLRVVLEAERRSKVFWRTFGVITVVLAGATFTAMVLILLTTNQG